MRVRSTCACCIALSLGMGAAGPAWSQDERKLAPGLAFGVSAGGHFVLKAWDAAETDATGAAASPESSLMARGRLIGRLSPLWSVALGGAYTRPLVDDQRTDELLVDLELARILKATVVDLEGAIGGGAYFDLGAGREGDELAIPRFSWGLGVSGWMSGDWRLRVDMRHAISKGLDSDSAGHLFELTFGVERVLWEVLPPPPDGDGDGVPDDDDTCPEAAAPGAPTGCPDSDGDGVIDPDDACPDVAGTAGGCPPKAPEPVAPEPVASEPVMSEPATPEPMTPEPAVTPEPVTPEPVTPEPIVPEPTAAAIADPFAAASPPAVTPAAVAPVATPPAAKPSPPAVVGGIALDCETLNLGGRKVTFQPRHYALTDEGQAMLDDLARFLKTTPEITRLRIEGHVDPGPSSKADDDLTLKQVWVVREYLRKKGVSKKRIGWQGMGSGTPIASNDTDDGRAVNRRVDFRVLEGPARPDCPAAR